MKNTWVMYDSTDGNGGSCGTTMEKTNWVMYDQAEQDGGSCGEVTAANYDDIIEQVDIEQLKRRQEKMWKNTEHSSDGFSAQNDADYSQVVRWYPDGTITVMVDGIEHPYTAADVN